MSNERDAVNRRRFLRYSSTGAVATVAGCQSLNNGNGGGDGGDGGAVAGSARDKPFVLGLVSPEPDNLGAPILNAAELAVDYINEERGGILGADVELAYGDSSGGGGAARRAYNKLTTEENVDMTFGALNADDILTSIAKQETLHFTTASASELPARLVSKSVSPLDGDPEEEYERFKYHFRAGPINTTQLLDAFSEFFELYADEFGWETLSVLVESGEDSSRTVDRLVNDIEDVGLEVGWADDVSSGISDWSPIFDEIENQGTDLLVINVLLAGTSLVRQWADQQRPFAMGGIHILSMLPGFWDETGGAAEGVFTMNAVTPQTTNTDFTQQFMELYEEEFGNRNVMFAAPITFDAARIYAQAVDDVGTADVDELIPYLEDEFVFQNGSIIPDHAFRPPDHEFAHDPVWECMVDCEGEFGDGDPYGPTGVPVWQQWQERDGEGVMEAFAPEINASAEYVQPPWMR